MSIILTKQHTPNLILTACICDIILFSVPQVQLPLHQNCRQRNLYFELWQSIKEEHFNNATQVLFKEETTDSQLLHQKLKCLSVLPPSNT